MRALVTGATGKVGNAVARELAARGDEVRVLVRDPARAAPLLPEGLEPVRGDVTDPASLVPAVEGCEVVFNAMGLPEQFLADSETFERVNARGTENVVRAARAADVRRVVHTSTIDVFHAEPGQSFDESEVATYPKGTAYERSKQHAEELALAARDGMELVMVNPAGVYGPGPLGSASLERDFLEPLVRGRLPVLPPGGMGMSFTDGVGRGHLLAAERGRDGERYILCDRHATFRDMAEIAVKVAGRGRIPPQLPERVAKLIAPASEALGRMTRRPPLLPRGQLHFFLWNAQPDSSKAQRELGWEPTPLEEGFRRTLETLGV
ncbi:MAG: NAD-dependent epimerase/dehydratase family protein [Thermoleophilaceae bacterium]